MEATSGSNNATDVPNLAPAEANQVEATAGSTVQHEVVAKNKHKETERKSSAWKFFEPVRDTNGVVIKGKCLYCSKTYHAHSKIHGTSLKNHVLHCMKISRNDNTRHALLTLNPASKGVEAQDANQSAVIGT